MNKKAVLWILAATILLGGVQAVVVDLNVTSCSNAGSSAVCNSVSEHNSDDTGIGSTIGKGDNVELQWSDLPSEAFIVNEINLTLRHDGETGIGGAWTITFEDNSTGTTYGCSDNTISHVSTDTTDTWTSACSLTVDQLNSMQLDLLSGDDKGNSNAYITYIELDVSYSTRGYSTVTIDEPANNSNYDIDSVFTLNGTVTCNSGDCDFVAIDARYNKSSSTPNAPISYVAGTQNLSILNDSSYNRYWNIVDDQGDGAVEFGGAYVFLGDTAFNNVYYESVAMFQPLREGFIRSLDVNVNDIGDDDEFGSGDIQIYICEITSDICDLDKCSLFNNTYDPVFGSDGIQTITTNNRIYVNSHKNYTVYVNSSFASTPQDVLRYFGDSSGTENHYVDWFSDSTCSGATPESAYIDIQINYLNELNFSLQQGESVDVSFSVNFTGDGISDDDDSFKIDIRANNGYTSNDSIDITVHNYSAGGGGGDSCTYGGSGDWSIDCSDACTISSTNDLGGNDVTFTGPGTVTITSSGSITNWQYGTITNCFVNNVGGLFG